MTSRFDKQQLDVDDEGSKTMLDKQERADRQPVPVGWPEASHHGAVQAAADAILALWERRRTGLGQHLDSSMQAAVLWTLLFATGHSTLYGEDTPGWGEKRGDPPPQLLPGLVIPNVARCKDVFQTRCSTAL